MTLALVLDTHFVGQWLHSTRLAKRLADRSLMIAKERAAKDARVTFMGGDHRG